SYIVTYQATDGSSNVANTITRTVNVVDTQKPELTLSGESEISLEVHSNYTEQGAAVTDNYDSDLQAVITSDLEIDVLGSYIVTYQATDGSSNVANTITRTVNVMDTTLPIIILHGESEITLEVFDVYTEQGAEVSDNYDSDLQVVITSDFDINVVGNYTVTYQSIDLSSNAANITRTINVVDRQIPGLTLNGESEITLEVHSAYTEQGAAVTDNYDTNLQAVINSDLDISVLGNYTVTYESTDSSSNVANSISRTVNIVDTTAPELSLIGESEITIFEGDSYQELGALVSDNYDTGLNIQISDNISNQSAGIYSVTYQVTDGVGNQNSITRIVNVIEDLPPQISLNGEVYIELYAGDSYTELNASAMDDKDGELMINLVSDLNNQVPGQYELTYSVTDSNNQTVAVTRWVTVLSTEFITTWQTDNEGVSENNQIRLEINSDFTYDFNVDWGDGQNNSNVTSEITHTYSQAGEYQVIISGTYPQIYFASDSALNSDSRKLLSVDHWGNNHWLSMHQAFYYAERMAINASDNPDLSSVTDMSEMFSGASRFNQDINSWDVSSVTDMSEIFKDAISFNQALSGWDVSSVTDMKGMFDHASSFNQDLSGWELSKVIDMSSMFYYATSFNENLSGWDLFSVKNMYGMFWNANSFNQDLSSWSPASVTNMNRMFFYARSFNEDVSSWNVSSVKDMGEMFLFADSFNQNLSSWNVSSVTSMYKMFGYASSFNQDISLWNVSSVKSMRSMFYRASDFNQDLSKWQVSSVTTMSSMFFNATSFNQGLSLWNVSSVIYMGGAGNYDGMFQGATSFDQDLSSWDISSVTHMGKMFKDVTLSTENYDALLISWSNKIPKQNVEFDGGESTYTPNSLAQTARTYLVDTMGWTITDGGAVQPD
ncbi:MAG: BspA family leucine-rich repeat surface protein, partial [Pseudomonadales bacterium]|nr:BspA family leucine-rich repeat surface protein [Pseudomonadales bacterium]